MPAASDVTQLLLDWSAGDRAALDRLLPLVQSDLRRVAARQMRGERADHTLQPTALVHEAFLRLVDQQRVRWDGRSQFFAIAARLMRRVLIDHARRRGAAKRMVVEQPPDRDHAGPAAIDLLVLDAALERLAAAAPRQAQVVELKFFGGLTIPEMAQVLGRSAATVKVDWETARAYLYRELSAVPPER